jgi:hypothetical protein
VAVGIRIIGKPVHRGGDVTVIFQGSHRGAAKGCGRHVGCVGAAAKVHGWSGLWRAGLAQQEKEWWRRGNLRVRAVKTQRRRGIFGRETSNEGMGRLENRGKSGEYGRMLKEANGRSNAGEEEAR